MIRSLLTISLFLFTLIGSACHKAYRPEAQESCFFQQNSQLQRLSWKNRPVTMFADKSLSEDQVESVKKSIEIWNDIFREQLSGGDIFIFGGVLNENRGVANDGYNVISLTEEWEGAPEEQAETYLRWYKNLIIEGDIRLNGEKKLSQTERVNFDEIDIVALLVHELGHVLGLDHIEDQGYTVMAKTLARGDSKRWEVGKVDIDALRCEY